MQKETEPTVKVALPLSVWEDMKAAGIEEERSGRYMVIRACKRDLEKDSSK